MHKRYGVKIGDDRVIEAIKHVQMRVDASPVVDVKNISKDNLGPQHQAH
jgi:predicted P-loop ATPase